MRELGKHIGFGGIKLLFHHHGHGEVGNKLTDQPVSAYGRVLLVLGQRDKTVHY